jgi:hypothetical protein
MRKGFVHFRFLPGLHGIPDQEKRGLEGRRDAGMRIRLTFWSTP